MWTLLALGRVEMVVSISRGIMLCLSVLKVLWLWKKPAILTNTLVSNVPALLGSASRKWQQVVRLGRVAIRTCCLTWCSIAVCPQRPKLRLALVCSRIRMLCSNRLVVIVLCLVIEVTARRLGLPVAGR